MTTIETVATIGQDRKLVLTLPAEVRPGSHRLMLTVLDDGAADDAEQAGGELELENGLLLFNGPVPADLDIRLLIERSRDERTLSILFGGDA